MMQAENIIHLPTTVQELHRIMWRMVLLSTIFSRIMTTTALPYGYHLTLTHIKYIYDYHNGSWRYWIRGLPAEYQTLDELKLGEGYWIYISS